MAAGCFGISEQPYPRGQLSPRVRHPRWAMAQAGTASSQPGSMGGWQTRPAGHRHHMGTGEHQGDPTRDMRQGASHQGKTIPTGPGRAVSAAGTRHTRGAGQRVTLGLGHTVPVDVCAGGTRRGAGGACGVGRVRDETAARGWDMPCPWVGHAVPVGWDMLCPWGGTHRSCGPWLWVGHVMLVGGTCRAHGVVPVDGTCCGRGAVAVSGTFRGPGWDMPCPWARARGWDTPCPWGRGCDVPVRGTCRPSPAEGRGYPLSPQGQGRQSRPAPTQAPPTPPPAANETPLRLGLPLPRCHHTPARGGGGSWAGSGRGASPSIGRAAPRLAPPRALPCPEHQSARGRRARGACPQRHPEGAEEPSTVGAAAAAAEGALVGPAGPRRAGPGAGGRGTRGTTGLRRGRAALSACEGVRAPHLRRQPPVPEGSGGPLGPGGPDRRGERELGEARPGGAVIG